MSKKKSESSETAASKALTSSSGSDLCTKCPECGFDHTIESCDDSLAEGYRVCANPECHQEWYVDIDYNQNRENRRGAERS